MENDEVSAFVVGIMVGIILTAFCFGFVPKDANNYHSFTKAMCVEDCKYLEDFEIQCHGDTLYQIHPSGFYIPNTKGVNISIDAETICVRD